MKSFLLLMMSLSALLAVVLGRPETPHTEYGPPPSPPSDNYGPPPAQPAQPAAEKYLPPPPELTPADNYGPPPSPKPVYGPPKPIYGPPPVEKIITKNIYVHIPPDDGITYLPSAPIHVSPPKKHYKIIFIKAPAPPSPTQPIVPVQPQDEHKTLVYVLVKKPDEQLPISIPTPQPTEPSKPEVYFIKYKNGKKPAAHYGPPPAAQYGPPPRPRGPY